MVDRFPAGAGRRVRATAARPGRYIRSWNKWLGPDTEYKMARTDKVVSLNQLAFDPIP